MNWVYSVAVAAVTATVVLGLLSWVRSHRLANQQQSSAVDSTELCETGHGTEEDGSQPPKHRMG
jgi:hypothetical protein